jgi:preprotein translocase subunit YajC
MALFKSKKNIAVLAAALVLVLGMAFGFMWWQNKSQQSASETTDTVVAPTRVAMTVRNNRKTGLGTSPIAGQKRLPGVKAGKPGTLTLKPGSLPSKPGQSPVKPAITASKPGAPQANGKPGATLGKTDATAVVSNVNVARGPDPFRLTWGHILPPPRPGAPPKPVVVPLPSIPRPVLVSPDIINPQGRSVIQHPEDQSLQSAANVPRRMAGVLFSDGIYAILETNGRSQTVKPGDTVDGGKVISIQSDSLTIKTDSNQVVKVPLSPVSTGEGTL